MPALSVLLVEDNEIDAEITRRVLAACGAAIDLRIARDGEEALQALCQPERPRLILLDLRLPGMDGWEVLRRVKNSTDLCLIPVAVLTGLSDDRLLLECLELGGNMFFVKPISRQDAANLLPAIEKYWRVMDQLQSRRTHGPPDAHAAG